MFALFFKILFRAIAVVEMLPFVTDVIVTILLPNSDDIANFCTT